MNKFKVKVKSYGLLPPPRRLLGVCLSVCTITPKLMNILLRNFYLAKA